MDPSKRTLLQVAVEDDAAETRDAVDQLMGTKGRSALSFHPGTCEFRARIGYLTASYRAKHRPVLSFMLNGIKSLCR